MSSQSRVCRTVLLFTVLFKYLLTLRPKHRKLLVINFKIFMVLIFFKIMINSSVC